MTENKGYLQRYAMLFGTYMGGFWILKFILFPLGFYTPFLLLLFACLTICVPFMGYYYARMYRNQICGGSIGFLQAWVFTVFMYMFAALLTAVAHYIYFRFIDQGFIINTYEGLVKEFTRESAIPGMDVYITQIEEAISIIRTMTPIDITMQLMSQNVIYGSLLAIPTALIVMKRKRSDVEL